MCMDNSPLEYKSAIAVSLFKGNSYKNEDHVVLVIDSLSDR
jgi:hypothetical protein